MRKNAYLVLLVAVLLCGCKGNNLIGKWNVSGMEIPMPGATVTAEFTSTDLNLNINIPNSPVKQKFVGTYQVDGENMTLNIKDWVVDGEGAEAEAAKKMIGLMKDSVISAMNKQPKATIKWSGKDSFTITKVGADNSTTYTRAN